MRFSLSGNIPRTLDPEFYEQTKVYFYDIKGFTALCESLLTDPYGAEKVFKIITRVFKPLIDAVHAQNGEVLAFSGDGLAFALPRSTVPPPPSSSSSVRVKLQSFPFKLFPCTVTSPTGNSGIMFFSPLRTEKTPTPPPLLSEISQLLEKEHPGSLLLVPLGFAHLPAHTPPTEALELIKELVALAETRSIYVNKVEFLDKGWMVLFSAGVPIVVSDAPERLLDFCSHITKLPDLPKPSIGCSMGRVFAGIVGSETRWEYTFLGECVNLAARLAHQSEPGSVNVSESLASFLRKHFSFTEKVGSFKNLGELRFYRLKKKKPTESSEFPFVGRREFLAEAVSVLSSPFSLLYITGDSGMGKTALARQINKTLGTTLRTFKGDSGSSLPFHPFRRLLLNPDKTKILRFFMSINSPALFLLDDFHFFDKDSIEAVKLLLSIGNPHVRFIITCFDDSMLEIAKFPLSRYSTHVLRLKGMSEEEIALLCELLGRKVSKSKLKRLRELTDGNPLMVKLMLELDLEKGLSPNQRWTFQEIILTKLKLSHPGTQEYLNYAAIYGDRFDSPLVGKSAGLDSTSLEAVERSAQKNSLIVKESERIAEFRNFVIKETVRSTMLEEEVREKTRRLAEVIAASGGSRQVAADLLFAICDPKFPEIVSPLLEHPKRESQYPRLAHNLRNLSEFGLKKEIPLNLLCKACKLLNELPAFLQNADVAVNYKNILLSLDEEEFKKARFAWMNVLRTLWLAPTRRHSEELLQKYKEVFGEDTLYKWGQLLANRWKFASPESLRSLVEEVSPTLSPSVRLKFLLDALFAAVTITLDPDLVSDLKKAINSLITGAPKNLRRKYHFLLLHNHLFRMELDQAEEHLKELKKLGRYKYPLEYEGFLYANKATLQGNPKLLLKAEKYLERAEKQQRETSQWLKLCTTMRLRASLLLNCFKTRKGIRNFLLALKTAEHLGAKSSWQYTHTHLLFMLFHFGGVRALTEEVFSEKTDELLPKYPKPFQLFVHSNRYLLNPTSKQAEIVNKLALELSHFTNALAEFTGALLLAQLVFERKTLPLLSPTVEALLTRFPEDHTLKLLKWAVKTLKGEVSEDHLPWEKLWELPLLNTAPFLFLKAKNEGDVEKLKLLHRKASRAHALPLKLLCERALAEHEPRYEKLSKKTEKLLNHVKEIPDLDELIKFLWGKENFASSS